MNLLKRFPNQKRKKMVNKKKSSKKKTKKAKKVLEKDFYSFQDKIARLEAIRQELQKLDTRGFEKEVNVIKARLKDTRALPELERSMKLLREKILKKKIPKKSVKKKKERTLTKKQVSNFPTLGFKTEVDIATDFGVKAYQKFDKMIKAIILFGSSVKQNATSTSDVDIVLLIDDASIVWDQELIAWYREELGKLVAANPYQKELHISTVKLTTWWNDLLKGDPVVVNVLRYGEPIIDLGGFFNPLKSMLIQGKIRSTPEAIYVALSRAPEHFRRSKIAELGAIEGLFWAMVDSAQAALMAANVSPPSPEHISRLLNEIFVDAKKLNSRYPAWYKELHILHRKIAHGEINDLKGVEIDKWQERTEDFIKTMTLLIRDFTSVSP